MLEEINIFSFSKYGKVQSFSPKKLLPEYSGATEEIDTDSAGVLIVPNYEVYLRPINGMGIIYFEKQIKGYKYFLFDKPITVNPGVKFGIMAYEQKFKYEIFTKEKLKTFQSNAEYSAFVPNLCTKKLVTAFYYDKTMEFEMKNQTRDFWQLIYSARGDMKCALDSSVLALNENDCIFIKPGQLFSLSSNGSRNFSFLHMIFDMDINPSENFFNRVFTCNVHVKHILSEVIFEVRRDDDLKYNIISSYIPIIINAIKRENDNISTILQSSYARKSMNATVENCIRIISDNINGDLSVPTIAKYLHISPSYLSKIFKDEKGINLSEYIREYRLEMSTELIKECRYSLSEIADMVGFCSINYFSSQFKIKYGIPPKEYFKTLSGGRNLNDTFESAEGEKNE